MKIQTFFQEVGGGYRPEASDLDQIRSQAKLGQLNLRLIGERTAGKLTPLAELDTSGMLPEDLEDLELAYIGQETLLNMARAKSGIAATESAEIKSDEVVAKGADVLEHAASMQQPEEAPTITSPEPIAQAKVVSKDIIDFLAYVDGLGDRKNVIMKQPEMQEKITEVMEDLNDVDLRAFQGGLMERDVI